MKTLIFILMLFIGCGEQAAPPINPETRTPEQIEVERLRNQLIYLQGTITELNNMVYSDFATCASSGDASDALINKICKVAQASTVEAKVEMKEELQTFSNVIQEKLDYATEDLADIVDDLDGVDFSTMASDIAQLQTDVTTINGTLSTLQTDMTNAQNAITALENLTASINGTLNGTVTEIQIGNENVAAGPTYESLLKRVDNTRITGYIEAFGSDITLASDPVAVTNASATATITSSAAHGLTTGERILIVGVKKGKGWSSAEINGEYEIQSTPTTTTLTITLSRTSTKTGSFGGSAALMKEVLGRGLGLVWSTGDGDDTAVRVANPRGHTYNFIIVEDGSSEGWVCYDKTDAAANFATLSGAGCQTDGVAAGNCVCK